MVTHYDGRAGMEADLKSDKRGLALAVIRKRRLAAQKLVVLLIGLAHNLLLWARGWLAQKRHDSATVASCACSRRSGPCQGGSRWSKPR